MLREMVGGSHFADTKAVVLRNTALNRDYWHLVAIADPVAASALPGQFFNLECPPTSVEFPILRRPMSIYRTNAATHEIEFLYKVTGSGTRALSRLQAQSTFRVFGPLGRGFRIDKAIRHIVVLGRGVGLATLAPLAEAARKARVGVTAILSARSADFVMSVERFCGIGAEVKVVLDSDGSSDIQNVERMLRRVVEQNRDVAFYTCGSNRLLLLMQRVGRELNIDGEVALEQQMACGIGMCFTCVRHFNVQGRIDTRRVCHDGPVFGLQEAMEWR
jgi:dihydroorotate dehydrogenase electron transfer subunit